MLTEKEFDIINFIEQEWLAKGGIPSGERAEELGLCKASWFKSFLDKPEVRKNLLARGINFAERKGLLTEQQLTAANVMLDLTDNRSRKKKLADLKIPTQLWESWLSDPAFNSYLRERSERILGTNQHEAHLALIDRVKSGDISAVKYYNEITGRYVPNRGDSVDIPALLMRVLEIIQKHVTDNVAAAAIAEDLLTLASGVGIGVGANRPRELTVSASEL